MSVLARLVAGLMLAGGGSSIAAVYGPDGTVNAMAYGEDGTLYLGGSFGVFGSRTGNGARVDAVTGAPHLGFPVVSGFVEAIAPDGSGGFYIGGDFTSVGGQARTRLAHIDRNGALTDWNPVANGTVYDLAVSEGTVYAGGAFTTIGGVTRNRLAAIGTNGTLSAWNPDANNIVYTLGVSGSTVYLGGLFTTIGGVTRNRLAAIGTDGTLSAWDPAPNQFVLSLFISGDVIYVGGNFSLVGGVTRNKVAAIGTDGTTLPWNPNANWMVQSVAVLGDTVYVGGGFTAIGGQARNYLAAVGTNGTVTGWNPGANGVIYSLGVSDDTVYVGGGFTTIAGTNRTRIAAFTSGGTLTDWNPGANNDVRNIAVSDGGIYLGGYFTVLGGVTRNNLAAISPSGELSDWNPVADNAVYALAYTNGTVYVGGGFTAIDGSTRNRLAAIGTNGTLASWAPSVNGTVHALALNNGVVYLAGDFEEIEGETRNYAGAVGTNGVLASWNPNLDNSAYALAVAGGTIYLGGDFTSLGGNSRDRLAAISTGGTVAGWNPGADGAVRALAAADGKIYIGGNFGTVGGQTRNHLAAVNSGGSIEAWNPDANGGVKALAMAGGTVYVGGDFTMVGGETRNRLAAVGTDGTLSDWDPDADNTVNSLAVRDGSVAAGGEFTSVSREITVPGAYLAMADTFPPAITSINRASVSPATGTSVDFTVVFDESVTGVDATDFTVTATGTAGGTVASVTGSGTTYTVVVGSVTGTGTLRLDLNGSGTGIVDSVGNAISGGFTSGQTYSVSPPNSDPTDIALSNSTANESAGANATVGTLITTDADSGDSHAYTLVSGTGDTDNASFAIDGSTLKVGASALAVGSYSVRIQTDDGNGGSFEEAFAITVVDDIVPQVVSIVRKTPTAQTIRTNQVVFEVTFSEPVSGVVVTNFLVSKLNSATVSTTVSALSGGPTVYDVTVDVGAGAGEFRLDLGPMRSTFATGFSQPKAIVFDTNGHLYVADGGNNTIRKVTADGTVTTLATGINNINGIAISAAGDLYATAGSDVKKVTTAGVVSTFATGFSTGAGLAFDTNGNLFVGNYGNSTISKVTTNGVVSTYASSVSSPFGLVVDRNGLLYVAHRDLNTISTVSAAGVLTEFATGFDGPHQMEFDAAGNLYVADRWYPRIAKVSTNGTVTTYAGGLGAPFGLAFSSGGDLFYSDYLVGNTLGRLTPPVIADASTNLLVDLPYAAGETYIADPNDAPTALALSTNSFVAPQSAGATLAVLSSTDADVADTHTYSLVSGTGDTHNGSFSIVGDELRAGGTALAAGQYSVRIASDDGQGGFYTNSFILRLVDEVVPQIASITRKIPSAQTAHTNQVVYEVTFTEAVTGVVASRFAVTPVNGSDIVASVTAVSGGPTVYEVTVDIASGSGDFRLDVAAPAGPVLYATTYGDPWGLAFSTNGDLYVSHYLSNTVSRVTTNGTVSIMATGLNRPTGLAVDATNMLYASYAGLSRVYKIATNGTKTLFVTSTTVAQGLAFAPDRRLYVAGTNALFRVETNGSRSTVTNGLASARGVAYGPDGLLYIASFTGNTVVRVATNGTITPFLSGLNAPVGVVFDTDGNLYVANSGDNTVVRVAANGVASTLASGFSTPYGLAINGEGDLFVANHASTTVSRVSLARMTDLAGNQIDPLPYTSAEVFTYVPNAAPTDLALSGGSLGTSTNHANATVGTLSTTDADVSDMHTYALVSGAGDTNNASFTIDGDSLKVGASALELGSYSVRIQTDDGNGGTYEEAFTITVVDDVAPTVVSIVRYSPGTSNVVTDSATWRVTFSEPVAGVDAGDFTLTALAGNVGLPLSSFTGDAATYDFTVGYTNGIGEYRLDLNASATGIADFSANAISGGYTNGESYLFSIQEPAAPILDDSQSPVLSGIAEDVSPDANNGTAVADIVVAGSITDPNGTAVIAIAVTGADGTNGTWQFSIDNGVNWTAFGSVSDASARLLDGTPTGGATQRIRFLPATNFNGSASIAFRAWDMGSGSAGNTADTTVNGGTTAFSVATDTASISVTPVNDAPTFSSSGSGLSGFQSSNVATPVGLEGTNSVFPPQMALASIGSRYVMAWTDMPNTSTISVKAQVFDATGSPLTSVITVTPAPLAFSTARPVTIDVGMDATGRFAVVYDTVPDVGGLYDIALQLYNADGTTNRSAFFIGSSSRIDSRPSISVLSNGRILVGYNQATTLGSNRFNYSLFASFENLASASNTSISSASAVNPDMAFNVDGNALISSQIYSSSSTVSMRFVGSGGTLTAATTFTYGSQVRPSLINVNNSSDWLILYLDTTSGTTNLVMRAVSPGATLSSAPVLGGAVTLVTGVSDQFRPSGVVDADGILTAAYAVLDSGVISTLVGSFDVSGTAIGSALVASTNTPSGFALSGGGGEDDGVGLAFGRQTSISAGANTAATFSLELLIGSRGTVFTDTAAPDGFANSTGQFEGQDVEGSELTYDILGSAAGGTIDSVSYSLSKSGAYGVLYLNAADGMYVFVPDAAAINALSADASESFTVSVSDGELSATLELTISFRGVNDHPTALALSGIQLGQEAGAAATVGTLTTTDAESADSHIYTLVAGAGDTDNASFVIETNVLKVGASALALGDYSVRIQTDDGNGGTYAEAFTVTVVDDVAPTITGVAGPASGAYRAGQDLDFTVTYDEAVAVTGTPRIDLMVGSASRSADYLSGSNSTTLVFRYTVQSGDSDTNGVVAVSPLALNGGTIQDEAGNDGSLVFTPPATGDVLVDTTAPTVLSIVRQTPSAQVMRTNTVVFRVTFSESVTGLDAGRLAVATINGGTVAGHVASITTNSPTEYDVAVSVTGGAGDFRLEVGAAGLDSAAFGSGYNGPVAFAFDTAGNLYVANNVGSTVAKIATDGSVVTNAFGSGYVFPTSLAFDASGYLYVASYSGSTVKKVAPDGTVVSANFGSGYSGPSGLAFDAAGNLYVANQNTHRVSKVAPDGTVITNAFGSGYSQPCGLAFDAEGNLYVANGGGAVSKIAPDGGVVTNNFGSGYSQPYGLAFGPDGNLYVANRGDNRLTQVAPDGGVITNNYGSGYNYPAGVAFDAEGNLYVANLADNSVFKIRSAGIRDLVENDISNVPYADGEAYSYDPNDAPTGIALSNSSINESGGAGAVVGALTTTDADSGDGHTYSLVGGTGDADNGLFNIETNTLKVGGSAVAAGDYSVRIRTDDGHDGTFSDAFTITVVDDVAPVVTSVDVPADGTYRAGAALEFKVNVSEPVTVTGTPTLELTVGSTVRTADFQSGSGTAALVFRYTVGTNDLDADGVVVGALSASGGTLWDGATNDAIVTLNDVAATTGVRVDGVAPRVLSVKRKTPSQQIVDTATVVFEVTFSEDVANVDASLFAVAAVNGGTITANVTGVSGGPRIYDVTVQITGGLGEFRLEVGTP